MSSLIVEACKIESVEKHPNADKLDVAKVKGWYCIVGRDQHKAGELITFIPPDSILPAELVEKYNLTFLKNGSRVRTLKLRGFVSQGLVLPLPEGKKWKEGDDLKDVLKITKWEQPQNNSTGTKHCVSKKRRNPYFDRYTEIENVKNFNNVFKEGDEVSITEKIHGSNIRFGYLKRDMRNIFQKLWAMIFGVYEYVYGSHNIQLDWIKERNGFYKDNVYWQMFKKYDLKSVLRTDMIIYGEVYGPKIQDITYGLPEIDLVVFDIKYEGKYMDHKDVLEFCQKNKLPFVPVLYEGVFTEEILKEKTSGMSVLCATQFKEGCVVKSLKEEINPRIGRKVLKSINPEYLLRENGTENK